VYTLRRHLFVSPLPPAFQLVGNSNGVRSSSVEVRNPSGIQSQLGPVRVDTNRCRSSGTVEVVHETGSLIGGGASQQVAADVARVDGEIHERVDDDDSVCSEDELFVFEGDVVGSGVSSGGELRSSAIADGTEIDAVALDEVGGSSVGQRVTDEAQVTHAYRSDDSLRPGVDLGNTDGQDEAREVGRPIEDGRDLSASGASGSASEIDQEQVVVQEGSGSECVASEGSREELGNHQTDIDVDGERSEISGVGERGLRGVEGCLQVSVGVEVVDGSSEGERRDVVTDGAEVSLGVGVQERSGPDEVGDDESEERIVVSSVRVPAGEGDGVTVGISASEPGGERGIAKRISAGVSTRASGEYESVQTTRCVTSIIAHLADDPRPRSILVEFVCATSRKIVGGVERRDHVGIDGEEESIVLVSTVDVANGNMHEKAQ